MKLVIVTWRDAAIANDWRGKKAAAADRRTLCKSVGWVARDGKDTLTLVGCTTADQVNAVQHIPRGMIVKVKALS